MPIILLNDTLVMVIYILQMIVELINVRNKLR